MNNRNPTIAPGKWTDVVMRAPVNWTGIWFFLLLSGVHLGIAAAAFLHRRWEGYLSLALAPVFFGLALAAWRFRFEMTVCPERKLLMMRHSLGRFGFTRTVAFASIVTVRRTLCGSDLRSARIELLCVSGEEIEAPSSCIPNQQALYFAMAIGVPLQKVSCDDVEEPRTVGIPEAMDLGCPRSYAKTPPYKSCNGPVALHSLHTIHST